MALDKNVNHINAGDIITVRLLVKSIEVGETGMNLRCETYDNGGSVPATQVVLLNSAQTEKTDDKPKP